MGTDIVRFVSVMDVMVDVMGFWHGLDAIIELPYRNGAS